MNPTGNQISYLEMFAYLPLQTLTKGSSDILLTRKVNMNYDEALCKTLPKNIKDLFMSFDIQELRKACSYCENCSQKEYCLIEGTSNSNNHGVWGGQILDAGVAINKYYSSRRMRYYR